MGLYQNCWREDEMLARKAFELVIVGHAVSVTLSNDPMANGAASGRVDISILWRNSAADSLQMQRPAIGDAIYGWRKPRFKAATAAPNQGERVGLEGARRERRRRFREACSPLASALCRGPRGLPMHGGDKGFEADAADDLFEGALSLRSGETRRALTVTCRESSRFSLVRRRRPRPAAEAA